MSWSDLHFLRPYWLIAMIPAALLLWRLYVKRNKKNFWQNRVDPHLLKHLLIGGFEKQSNAGLLLLAFVWLLAIIALAGPVWEKLPSPIFHGDNRLVIALDLSRSMNANDIIPSRLESAKIYLEKYLNISQDDSIGLVVFAEQAFVAAPLSQDKATARDMIKYAYTDIMPIQGSRPDRGILKAIELLQQTNNKPGHILLVTDGPSNKSTDLLFQAIEAAQAKSHTVSILAVGTAEGGLIPLTPGKARGSENNFLTQDSGKPVLATVDYSLLKKMAAQGGGHYNLIKDNNSKLDELVAYTATKIDNSKKKPADKTLQWKEFGPYLLFVLIPLSALAFRRGWAGSILLSLVFSHAIMGASITAEASTEAGKQGNIKATWTDLWIRADYQAYKLFKQNRMQAAAEKFNHRLWRGNSWYRMGEFKKAEDEFASVDTATGHFNRGNALAQQGKIEAAIEAYSTALSYDMNFKDASVNRTLLKNYLEQKQKKNAQKKMPSQGKDAKKGQGRPYNNVTGGEAKNAEFEKQQSERQNQKGSSDKDRDGEKDKQSKKGKASNDPAQEPEDKQISDAEAADEKALAVQFVKEIKPSSTIGPDQWLNMIKDNPADLLKLKFSAQYLKSKEKTPEASTQAW